MKIKELIYNTPEVTEEKLLEIINEHIPLIRRRDLIKRIHQLHKEVSLNRAFLDEYDLIQDKNSYLTKSQRDDIVGFVGLCMIQMVKDNGGTDGSNRLETISES